ncbi:uncharacterized protein LOC143153444 [Ptiloglossa arizonensis]|uniref:uncharacterized protein LOC143153444 n=1 Tax=Ptiloglossa arizonensis TaxID=3350558 RepID=UPI003FA0E47E
MMDNYCAPQWLDFTRSPQLSSDSYFEIDHEVHRPLADFKFNLKSASPTECKKKSIKESSIRETNFDDSLEPLQNTKDNIAYFIPCDNKKHSTKQVKNENHISEAMGSLKLDEKSNKLYCAWNVWATEETSAFKMPKPSYKFKAATSEKSRKNIHMLEIKNNDLDRSSLECSQIPSSVGKNVNEQIALTKATNDPIVKSKIDYSSEYVKSGYAKKRSSYKIVLAQQRRSEMFKSKQSQPKVLACQYRRQSLVKYRRCSNQFISMAEAVFKFQNRTPQRFRTTNKKDLKPGCLMKLKQSPLKLTHPISPALRSKQRARCTNILSEEEREILQVEEMKKHQMKANPVPLNTLKGPSSLTKVAKKPVTITEEFHLTQPKKTHHISTLQKNTPHALNDKEQKHKNVRSIKTTNINVKSVENVSLSSFAARNKEFQMRKKEKLENLQVQENNKTKVEFHAKPAPKFLKSSNPVKEQSMKKRTVVSCPFSFAERDKCFAKKKEELVKQIQENDKKKRVFHANPIPSFKPVMVQGSSKGNIQNKKTSVSMSNEVARKSVLVPYLPKENVQSKKNVKNISMDVFLRQTKSYNDQENKQPNISLNTTTVTKKKQSKQHIVNNKVNEKQSKSIQNSVDDENGKGKMTHRKSVMTKFELNTDKRARARNEFNENNKKREQEQEAR